jgi:hypothetical protein
VSENPSKQRWLGSPRVLRAWKTNIASNCGVKRCPRRSPIGRRHDNNHVQHKRVWGPFLSYITFREYSKWLRMHSRPERNVASGLRPSSIIDLLLALIVVVGPKGQYDVTANRLSSSSVHNSFFNTAAPFALPLFPWNRSSHVFRTMRRIRGGGGDDEQYRSLNMQCEGMTDMDPRMEVDIVQKTHTHQPLRTTSNPLRTHTFPPSRRIVLGRRNNRERRQLTYRSKCRSPHRLWPNEAVRHARDYSAVSRRGGADWFGTTVDDEDDEFSSSTDSSSFSASSVPPSKNDIEMSRGTLDGDIVGSKKNPKTVRRSHSPVVYQYYGRSRNRGPSSPDAPHFLLLGPNVDHWKAVGQILASRGFNVMVCERIVDAEETTGSASSNNKNKRPQQLDSNDEPSDAPDLVLDLLGTCSLEVASSRGTYNSSSS